MPVVIASARSSYDHGDVGTRFRLPVKIRTVWARMEPTGAGEYVRARACSSVINRKVRQDGRIVDVGGGEGNLVHFLRRDLRPGYVVLDHLTEGHGCRIIGDLNRTPLRPESFDAVCISDVLEHIPDDRAALESIWESVAPGGLLVVHVPSEREARFRTIRAAQERAEDVDQQKFPHVRDGYSPEDLYSLVTCLQPASNVVTASFSRTASLVTDIDWILWWKGIKFPRLLTWLSVRATKPPTRPEALSGSSGLLCSARKNA